MKDKFTPYQKESLEDNEVYNLQRFLVRSRTTTSKPYKKSKTD